MAITIATGDPTKDFFVFMITKDISLADCIFDLIDNSIDGAKKAIAKSAKKPNPETPFLGFSVKITASADVFQIQDNCSGIEIDEAKQHAFRFGRRADAKPDASFGIGLYGIGMKRAVFKIGREIVIESSNGTRSFKVPIDVQKWLDVKDKWDFTLDIGGARPSGTSITIKKINPPVSKELSDPVFLNRLRTIAARDYSIILQKGFEIVVNGEAVQPFVFRLLEGGEFKPLFRTYQDEEQVIVSIYAGLASLPSDDDEPPEKRRPGDEYYGWFVVCNDRVVLAADKTVRTIWGDEDFQVWHQQYNGFMGIVKFESDDPKRLPWTTTKRDVEISSPVYRRAVAAMKDATVEFIRYTNARKANLEEAKQREDTPKPVELNRIVPSETLITPRFRDDRPRIRMSGISYQQPTAIVEKVKRVLGDSLMTNKKAGIETFKYYVRQEVEE